MHFYRSLFETRISERDEPDFAPSSFVTGSVVPVPGILRPWDLGFRMHSIEADADSCS